MGSRRHSIDRARSAITYERLSGNWHLSDQRFIIKYHWTHGERLTDQNDTAAILRNIDYGVKRGRVWTLIADGQVICIGGVLMKRKGVGELWSIPTRYIKQYPIFYFKAVRRIIGDAAVRHKLRRLQSLSRMGDLTTYNLHKHLGFKFEGVMVNYLPDGGDAVRGAITWDMQ